MSGVKAAIELVCKGELGNRTLDVALFVCAFAISLVIIVGAYLVFA